MDHMAGIMDACDTYEVLNNKVYEVQISDGEDAIVT
jgi:hypothetical protein